MAGMHGDLINGLCYTAFSPVYLYLWITNPEPGAGLINVFFLATVFFSWLSWWFNDITSSICAGLSMAVSIAAMNMYGWPHKGEVIVVPQFLWSLLIVSGNLHLPFLVKIGMAFNFLGMALFVLVTSPLVVSIADTLPLLLGATAVFCLFHYFDSKHPADSKKEVLNARLASIVLAGCMSYTITSELSKMISIPGYSIEGGYAIIRTGFFASIGLAAAGAFREQVDVKKALEGLVQERTKEIEKQAEELLMVGFALQESETAIAVTDDRQRIEWSNAAMQRLLTLPKPGAPMADLLNMSLIDMLDPPSTAVDKLRGCFDGICARQAEVCTGGKSFLVEVAPFPASFKREPQKLPEESRFLVVLKDVTEQRARERAEKLAEKEAMLKQAMIESMETLSHELRTPLQAVMGMSSLFLDDETATLADAREAMSIVMASSRLLLTLINNLLDTRKCDADMMKEFQLEPMCLMQAMSDSVSFCRPMAAITNVSLDLTLDSTNPALLVRSNPLRFQQIMINLVSNAIKYTGSGRAVRLQTEVNTLGTVRRQVDHALVSVGGIDVSLDDATPIVIVSVSDDGPGISKDAAGKIFEKFSQVTTQRASVIGGNTVAQPSGTGLGLNLCCKFIQRMQGCIWVSGSGEGATFSFFLHVAPEPQPQQVVPGDTQEQAVSAAGDHQNTTLDQKRTPSLPCPTHIRVLLVDDTVVNLKVLDRMLTRIGVGNVVSVDSGLKALQTMQEHSFDLVITDIQMPEMTGIELCDAIRQSDAISSKPVVVGLTAETSESLHQRCASSGMSHVLHKPITSAQISFFFDKVLGGLETCDRVTAGA